jgi:hypothetical protein
MALYRVEIPGWHPATVNQLLKSVRGRIRLKKADRKWVGDYLGLLHRVPRAQGRRRVSLRIILGPGRKASDVDAWTNKFVLLTGR